MSSCAQIMLNRLDDSESDVDLYNLYKILLKELGPHDFWWPANSPFEVVIGSILTQQTKWENVEKAISNLKQYELIEVSNLSNARVELVETLIRGTGFYRQKASRIIAIARHFKSDKKIFDMPIEALRNTLLSLNGIGFETADSIILYAANKPKFVIDTYTMRIMKCIGIKENYSKLQNRFENDLPINVKIYKEFHALIVEYAKQYCGKKRCKECLIMKNKRFFLIA